VLFLAFSVGCLGAIIVLLHIQGILPTSPGTGFEERLLGVPNYLWYAASYVVTLLFLIIVGSRFRMLTRPRLFLAATCLGLALGIAWAALSGHYSSILQGVVATIAGALLLALLYLIGLIGSRLDDRSLQIFGLLLTLLGILCAFVPLFLNLLDVPVN
jgi:hypothetical protein